jgi:Family of unknown function (DUF6152)
MQRYKISKNVAGRPNHLAHERGSRQTDRHAVAALTAPAFAHHSFAMFDAEHPIEVSGVVKEFRFVSPHTLLILEVKDKDGGAKEWMLEGGAPGLLVRDGMTSKSLKPGDEITAKINPLHSGAEGGSYAPLQLKFKDGRPVVAPK